MNRRGFRFRDRGVLDALRSNGVGLSGVFREAGLEVQLIDPRGASWRRWWDEYAPQLCALRAHAADIDIRILDYGVLSKREAKQFGVDVQPFLVMRPYEPLAVPDGEPAWHVWQDRIEERMSDLAQLHSTFVIHGGLGANGLWDPVPGLRFGLWSAGLKRVDPRCFAPEQIEQGWLGPWTDIHGLGLALSRQVNLAKEQGRWPDWSGLESWIRRCLEPDPDNRWRNMADAQWSFQRLRRAGGQSLRAGQYRPLVQASARVKRQSERDGWDEDRAPLPDHVRFDPLWSGLKGVCEQHRLKVVWLEGGNQAGQEYTASRFVRECAALGQATPMLMHIGPQTPPGAALGEMWARYWNLSSSTSLQIKRVVRHEMIRWGLDDPLDIQAMENMVQRAVGVETESALKTLPVHYERQMISLRLLRAMSAARPVLLRIREPQRAMEAVNWLKILTNHHAGNGLRVLVVVTAERREKSPNWSVLQSVWNGQLNHLVSCLPRHRMGADNVDWLRNGSDSVQRGVRVLIGLDDNVHLKRSRVLGTSCKLGVALGGLVVKLGQDGFIEPMWGARSDEWVWADEESKSVVSASISVQNSEWVLENVQEQLWNFSDFRTEARRCVWAREMGNRLEVVDQCTELARAWLRDGDPVASESLIEEREELLSEIRLADHETRWGEGWVLKGLCREAQARPAEAQTWLRRALGASHKYEWKEVMVEAQWGLGRVARDSGDGRSAWRALCESETMAKELVNSELLQHVQRDMGWMLAELGALEPAAALLRQARIGFDNSEDPMGSAACLVALAEVSKRSNRLALARILLEWARKRYEIAGQRVGLTACLWRLGEIYQLQGALQRAEATQNEARALFAKVGAPDWAVAELQIGVIRLEEGRYADAREVLEVITAHFDGLSNSHWAGYGRACLLPCLAHDGAWQQWDDRLDSARFLIRKSGVVEPNIARMAAKAGDMAMVMGEFSRARESFALAAEQYEAMGDDDGLRTIGRRKGILP